MRIYLRNMLRFIKFLEFIQEKIFAKYSHMHS